VNWELIYKEHWPAMSATAAQYVRGRPDLEAADVVHDAFVAAISAPPADEPDWQEYLARLMAEACTECLQWILDEENIPEPAGDDPETIAVRRVGAGEVRQRVMRVMDYMTERQREVTRLRLFEGRSVGEIAAIVDTTSSNVSQVLVRCLAKLAPILIQLDLLNEHDLEYMRPSRRVRWADPVPPVWQ
jgi:RNA polymerase sigma factor (sigma-70 family)